MNNDERKNTKMMPAICPQCGGQVEVDAQREKAFCQYCGMPFIVEKAINTYNVQHATIEHVDSINIIKTSAVESVLSFVKDQQKRIDDEKKEKKEEERKEREESNRRQQLRRGTTWSRLLNGAPGNDYLHCFNWHSGASAG